MATKMIVFVLLLGTLAAVNCDSCQVVTTSGTHDISALYSATQDLYLNTSPGVPSEYYSFNLCGSMVSTCGGKSDASVCSYPENSVPIGLYSTQLIQADESTKSVTIQYTDQVSFSNAAIFNITCGTAGPYIQEVKRGVCYLPGFQYCYLFTGTSGVICSVFQ
jgi:hypothetical protein